MAYVATGFAKVNALLPSLLGLVIGVLGVAAARIEAGQHDMHAVLAVALLGLLGFLSEARAVFSSNMAKCGWSEAGG